MNSGRGFQTPFNHIPELHIPHLVEPITPLPADVVGMY
jgi:hypothetical protein